MDQQIPKLKAFVEAVSADPSILQQPEFGFFRDFITKTCRGTIPAGGAAPSSPPKGASPSAAAREPKLDVISDDTESDGKDPDVNDPSDPQLWPEVPGDGDRLTRPPVPTDPVDEEAENKANSLKQEAVELMEAGKLDEAYAKYTEAIAANPTMPMTYTARANVAFKQRRPKEVLGDCEAALSFNPNSARALKLKGKTLRHMGDWEGAAKAIRAAQQVDFDDSLIELEQEINKKMAIINEHKKEREAKMARRRQRALRRQRKREQEEDAKEAAAAAAAGGGMPGMGGMGGMPGGMPGMGGMGGMPGMPGMGGGMPGMGGGMPGMGGGGMPDLSGMMAQMAPMMGVTPDEMADPQVKEALKCFPSNMGRVAELSAANPKVKSAMDKLQSGMSDAMKGMGGGMPGMGGMGGMPGMPGMGGMGGMPGM